MAADKTISVLFLTRYPVEGASSRYRVFQYVPYLEKMGIACTVQSFMDTDMYRLSLSSGGTVKKIGVTLRCRLSRGLLQSIVDRAYRASTDYHWSAGPPRSCSY